MDEQWKECSMSEYFVSSEGRVCSRKYGKVRMLSIWNSPLGYSRVNMRDELSLNHVFLVHQLVARAFIGDPPTLRHEVNHKNGVPSDNRVENLEWVTRSENLFHRSRVLGRKAVQARGGESHAARLTEADVLGMRSMRASGATFRSIAERYGCCPQNAHQILSGKTWANL